MAIESLRNRAITVYGTTWCRDCHLARAVLKLNEVDYVWVDIDQEPSAVRTVLMLNGGYRTVPTIVFPDGRVLVEPSRRELEAALAESQPAA
jgi:mycoredoxin